MNDFQVKFARQKCSFEHLYKNAFEISRPREGEEVKRGERDVGIFHNLQANANCSAISAPELAHYHWGACETLTLILKRSEKEQIKPEMAKPTRVWWPRTCFGNIMSVHMVSLEIIILIIWETRQLETNCCGKNATLDHRVISCVKNQRTERKTHLQPVPVDTGSWLKNKLTKVADTMMGSAGFEQTCVRVLHSKKLVT